MAGGQRDLNDDEMLWILLGCGVIVLLLGSGVFAWSNIAGWLIKHQVLVTEAVVVHLPNAGGAGLDVPRLALVVALVLLLVAAAIGARKVTSRARRGD